MAGYPSWSSHVATLSGKLVWASSVKAKGFKSKEAKPELISPKTSHTPRSTGQISHRFRGRGYKFFLLKETSYQGMIHLNYKCWARLVLITSYISTQFPAWICRPDNNFVAVSTNGNVSVIGSDCIAVDTSARKWDIMSLQLKWGIVVHVVWEKRQQVPCKKSWDLAPALVLTTSVTANAEIFWDPVGSPVLVFQLLWLCNKSPQNCVT